MNRYILIVLLICGATTIFAQVDSSNVEVPYSEYVIYRYEPTLQVEIPIYNYSNKWDLDGDNKNDSILFIGNGGAHAYFHLKIVLTSDYQVRDFPTFQLDMPYINTVEMLKELGESPVVQLVIHDFDGDGISEMYLNVDNPMSSIPKKLKKQGVTSPYILIDYVNKELRIKNFKNK